MPREASEKTARKLVDYIKKDRLKKFKSRVRKYDVNLTSITLSKGRTLLHCAAKHGCGLFTDYLLRHGVLSYQMDKKGDLPIHIALNRALLLSPQEAAEMYNPIVVPLLKDFPNVFYLCDHHGNSVEQLLTTLNRYMLRAFESDSDSSSDSESGSVHSEDSQSEASNSEEWNLRLFREFESESTEFFGRYHHDEDYSQEREKESYKEWAERMSREMHHRHNHQYYGQSTSSGSQKRKSEDHSSSFHPKPRKLRAIGTNTKEEISKVKLAQSTKRLRSTYEGRFQEALKAQSDRKMSFEDIPWPSKGSLEHVMEVLFGDKGDWNVSELKKFVREQQVRWHPDKFLQKFIDKIAPKSFERVMERAKEISQALNKKADSLSSGKS